MINYYLYFRRCVYVCNTILFPHTCLSHILNGILFLLSTKPTMTQSTIKFSFPLCHKNSTDAMLCLRVEDVIHFDILIRDASRQEIFCLQAHLIFYNCYTQQKKEKFKKIYLIKSISRSYKKLALLHNL